MGLSSSFLIHKIPYLYYGVLLFLFVLLSLSVQPGRFALLRKNQPFFWLCLLVLVIARLPSILYNIPLNVDEAQMIAQALTLLRDPVYWRSVDGTTIGPIDSYLQAWPGLFHLPITYATSRFTATLLLGVTLWYSFAAMRLTVSQVAARISLLFLLLFLCYTTHFDYVHFSSEIPALPILAYVWFVFIRYNKQPSSSFEKPGVWFIVGLVAGLIPFIKLQAVPLIGILVVGLMASLFVRNRSSLQSKLFTRPLVALLIGGVLPSLLVVGLCAVYGVTERFYLFYIKSNLFSYGQYYKDLYPNTQLPLWQRFARLPQFFTSEATFYKFFLLFILTTSLAVVMRLYTQKKMAVINRWIMAWSIGWLATAFYVVAMPGTEYTHHLWFVLIPMSWLMSLAFQGILSSFPERVATSPYVAALVIIPSLLISFTTYRQGIKESNSYLFAMQTQATPEASPVSELINRYARPEDNLVIWGWHNQYHVDTQLPQGTSENHSFRSIFNHSLRKAYQDKYMEDIEANKPVFFLDATGPKSLFMADTALYRYENFPPLARYIANRYTLIGAVDHVRVFMRNDRALRSGFHVGHQKSSYPGTPSAPEKQPVDNGLVSEKE